MVVAHNSSTSKNDKLKIYIDFRILNVATEKDPYPLPFTNEMLNIIIGYKAYSFLDGYLDTIKYL
jgi:hypothetical protein